ncbi:unnamed protein product, partial [Polarella glacialis]
VNPFFNIPVSQQASLWLAASDPSGQRLSEKWQRHLEWVQSRSAYQYEGWS